MSQNVFGTKALPLKRFAFGKHCNYFAIAIYHKRAKIRWAKHSQFQPYEVFRGNTFVMPWLAVFIV